MAQKPGDSVERDELIVEIETDKVVLEVVAPEAGTLTDVMAEEGDTVESEQVLGKIGEASGAGSKKESAASDDSAEKAESKEAAKPAGGKQHDVKAPSFPESIQEGTVATWHKKVGEAVKRDEVLADIETDKVVLEVVAPADGALAEIKAEEGSQVESEAILATFVEGGGSDQASASSSSSASSDADDEGADEKVGGKVLAPAARKMVAEHDLDVSRSKVPAKAVAF